MLHPIDPDDLDARSPTVIHRAAAILKRSVIPWHRGKVHGIENVPDGACLFVGNHNAGMYTPDTYVFLEALYDQGGADALPYALAHQEVFKAPPLGRLLVSLGAVRACHENATRIFERGHSILVYPGGDIDSLRPYSRRQEVVFGHRRGYIRLAITHGVPIVPVVADGAHAAYRILSDGRALARLLRLDKTFRLKALPIVLSFPFGVTIGPLVPFIPPRTQIRIRVLPPMHFERSGPEAAADEAYVFACAARVEGAMQTALTAMADEEQL
jgi:1-acyl-sn-glycerol-3-phosphate acyltransferase